MKKFCGVICGLIVVYLVSTCGYAESGHFFISGGAYAAKTGMEADLRYNGESIICVEDDESATGVLVSIGSINAKRMSFIEVGTLEYDEARLISFVGVYNRFIGGTDKVKPYLGAHAGLASMEWQEDLVVGGNVFELDGESASSGAVGVRAGLVVWLSDAFMLDFGYKYTATALETDLIFNTSTEMRMESKYNQGVYLTMNGIF